MAETEGAYERVRDDVRVTLSEGVDERVMDGDRVPVREEVLVRELVRLPEEVFDDVWLPDLEDTLVTDGAAVGLPLLEGVLVAGGVAETDGERLEVGAEVPAGGSLPVELLVAVAGLVPLRVAAPVRDEEDVPVWLEVGVPERDEEGEPAGVAPADCEAAAV